MGHSFAPQIEATSVFIDSTALPKQSQKNLPLKCGRMIAVGGGKGGVGKTFFTAALGIMLSSFGKETVIVDGDFNGANLHNCIGIPNPPLTSLDFFRWHNDDINQLLLDTAFKNLKILAGPSGVLGTANFSPKQKHYFLQQLRRLNADTIILDLGAGSSYSEIDLFNGADYGFIVTTPEPTSVQDSYNFLKLCLFRKLIQNFKEQTRIVNLLNSALNPFENRDPYPVSRIAAEIRKFSPIDAYHFRNLSENFRPKLIMNMVENQTDCEEGIALQIAARELLNISVEYSGFIPYDEKVRKAIRNQQPGLLTGDDSGLHKILLEIAKNSVLNHNGQAPTFDYLPRGPLSRVIFPTDPYENEIICSVKCSLWGRCSAQNGGYPCRVKYIGYAHQKD